MKKIKPVNSFGLLPTKTDIYSGEETIRFNSRHPIYKSLMKIEFEEVLRKYHKLTIIE
ncbi:MAG: hypothetical protein KGD72_00325 [Candidatus Lokiarchaeota archaeon]|nr:hypothetical protein [Candidatus Lokiarchaeota archaeon]